MGYNTVAVLYNDHTHLIREDGDVGRRIAEAMQSWRGPSFGAAFSFYAPKKVAHKSAHNVRHWLTKVAQHIVGAVKNTQ